MDCKLSIVPKASTDYVVVGDIFQYEITITNNSKNKAEDIVIKSLLLEELKFIYESVKIDNLSNTELNIISGINVGLIMPGDTTLITFDVEVMRKVNRYIQIEVISEFVWLIDKEKELDYCTEKSDLVHVNSPNLKISKKSNKKDVQLYDDIEYEISINNTGDLDLYNIIVKDEISNALELVDGTFMIDNNIVNSVDLSKGITISKLSTKESSTIKYTAKVVSGASGGKLINKARAKYLYILGNNIKSYKETDIVTTTVKMLISNFNQVSKSEYLCIDDKYSLMREINEINAKVKVEDYKVIKTPITVSKEGQKLSGYKLIIHGSIEQVLEYVALNKDNTISSYSFESPFSTYIILPKDFIPGTNIEVSGFIEDIKANQISSTSFFRSVEILMIAKVICYK